MRDMSTIFRGVRNPRVLNHRTETASAKAMPCGLRCPASKAPHPEARKHKRCYAHGAECAHQLFKAKD